MRFYKNKEGLFGMLSGLVKIARYLGWKPGENCMVCLQEGLYSHLGFVKIFAGAIGFPIFFFRHIDLDSAKALAANINKKRPTAMIAFPSCLSEFASIMEQNNLELTKSFKSIICVGEVLTPYQRSMIERVFGCPSFSVYVGNEIGVIATECQAKNGMHIMENRVLMENDTEGSMILTTLDYFDLPLIKYKTGDRGTIFHDKCACGISGLKIKEVEGRVEEYILNASGAKVYASYIRQLFLSANEKTGKLVRAQCIQKQNKSLSIALHFSRDDKAEDAEIEKWLIETIKKDTGLAASVIFGEVPFPERGKFKAIIRE